MNLTLGERVGLPRICLAFRTRNGSAGSQTGLETCDTADLEVCATG